LTLLVGGQEGHPACKKTEGWGAGVVICLERGADLHMDQMTPLPLTVSCFSKIQIGFTFLVPAHPGSPGKRAIKRVCVVTTATSLERSQPSFTAIIYILPVHLGCALRSPGGFITMEQLSDELIFATNLQIHQVCKSMSAALPIAAYIQTSLCGHVGLPLAC